MREQSDLAHQGAARDVGVPVEPDEEVELAAQPRRLLDERAEASWLARRHHRRVGHDEGLVGAPARGGIPRRLRQQRKVGVDEGNVGEAVALEVELHPQQPRAEHEDLVVGGVVVAELVDDERLDEERREVEPEEVSLVVASARTRHRREFGGDDGRVEGHAAARQVAAVAHASHAKAVAGADGLDDKRGREGGGEVRQLVQPLERDGVEECRLRGAVGVEEAALIKLVELREWERAAVGDAAAQHEAAQLVAPKIETVVVFIPATLPLDEPRPQERVRAAAGRHRRRGALDLRRGVCGERHRLVGAPHDVRALGIVALGEQPAQKLAEAEVGGDGEGAILRKETKPRLRLACGGGRRRQRHA